jgi:LPS-assembly lipoprotein
VIAAVALLLSACGFHLRGLGGSSALPASLSSLRVVMSSPTANEPLAVAVRQAVAQAGAQVVQVDDAPTVVLFGEQVDSQVASVRTSTGKASEYLLRYQMSFRLDGPQPVSAQTIRLQRDYSFDPTRVLAKEQEEQELLRDMRRDAAQQVVRRLARAGAQPAK